MIDKNMTRKVIKIIKKNSYNNHNKLSNDLLLKNDLNIDSMGYLALITDLENKFKISISDEDLISLNNDYQDISVGNVIKLVEKNLEERNTN